jgi:hypothetical protein
VNDADGYGEYRSSCPLKSRAKWPADTSNVPSLGVKIGLGDADFGEYSTTRGELYPEMGSVAGEVGFEEI